MCLVSACRLPVQLPATALVVPLFPTVMTHHVSPASATRGARGLRGAQHHGSGTLIARVAVLADVPHMLTLTSVPASTIHPTTLAKLTRSPPL